MENCAEDVRQRAREAQSDWRLVPVRQRVQMVRRLREAIVRRMDEISTTIAQETGRLPLEVLINEFVPTLEFLRYYEKTAPRLLRSERRHSPYPLFSGCESWVEYQPYGVVLVIGPWNLPLQLVLVPAVTALLAGNAVIVKPSELAPQTGSWIGRLLDEAGCPSGLCQIVNGGADAGQALVESQPDLIFFTGSLAVGREIAQRAAEMLVPVKLELGGKDPMVVFSDADLVRAAEAAVYAGTVNAGQLCVSIERIYVEKTVFDEFLGILQARLRSLQPDCERSPVINTRQLERIKRQVKEALSAGGTCVEEVPEDGLRYGPVLISMTGNSGSLMQEETFGPVLPVHPFADEAEALRLANDSEYGLNASVWSGDENRARRFASKLQTGNCFINNASFNIGNPDLPFGGAKQSGLGVYHGPEGLRSFCRPQSVMLDRKNARELYWYPFTPKLEEALRAFVQMRHGAAAPLDKLKALWRLLPEVLRRRRS